MPMPGDHRDLLIVSRDRVAFYDLTLRSAQPGLEVRLDRRQAQRRRTAVDASSDERRRGDRRAIDVSAGLATAGWVLVPAADRG
jgi:hypothetical protein